MHIEAHAAIGWLLANAVPGTTRPVRAAIFLSAIAPDVDAVAKLFGDQAYAQCHHALGHNVFFSLAFSLAALAVLRRQVLLVALLTQAGFYTHYFGDYFFTRFPLQFFWPVSDRAFIFGYAIGLDHPINLAFSYASLVVFAALAYLAGRTPLEFVWPALDQRLVRLIGSRPLRCGLCGRKANEVCESCRQPTCLRHASITASCRVRCHACRDAGRSVTAERTTIESQK